MAVPLLTAAGTSALSPLFRRHRRALDAISIAAAAAVTAMLAVVMRDTAHGDTVYWFAGFRPAHGVALGIDFAAGRLNSSLACLAALLVTASMTFSWRYFRRVGTYFHALMLTFLAGMTGFCLTGDIFNLFVWFELMGVSAYALTAYRRDRPVPLLARRRARGGAHPGLRAVLRRDGRTRPVRDRAGLLVGVRPGARAPGGDLAR